MNLLLIQLARAVRRSLAVAGVLLWAGWLSLGPLLAATGVAPAPPAPPNQALSAHPSDNHVTSPDSNVPQKARDLFKRLRERHGDPLPGYVGGRTFLNRERRLPPGFYREYDVNPKISGRSRDAERLVIEQRTGRGYYTGDHYRTFTPLHEPP